VRNDKNAPKQSVFDRSLSGGRLSGGHVEGMSFSGNERNSFFLNLDANRFEEISGVSGFDHPADGRAMGLLDYDRDGWLDLAIVNANSPLIQLFRNRIRDAVGERSILAIRFVGGNRTASPSTEFASRDGYGAIVEVTLGDARLVREHRAGEGFATQNSATLLIGLGSDVESGALRVRWPSGRSQDLASVPANSLVTVYEDAAQSPNGSGFVVAPYRLEGLAARAAAAPRDAEVERRLAIAGAEGRGNTKARLKLVTTMATWCEACKGELPQVKRLRAAFDADTLEILGVPVDENDTTEMLEAYVRLNEPAYTMLTDLSDAQIAVVKQTVIDVLRIDALPAAFITDREGLILRTLWEVPSVSEVRELLAKEAA
jgi:hypothetical protein